MQTNRRNQGRLLFAGALGTALLAVSPVSAYVFTSVVDQEGERRACDDEDSYGVVAPNVMMFMDRSGSMLEGSGVGGGPTTTSTNIINQGQKDLGLVNEPANAPGNALNKPGISLSNKVEIPSFVWAVNTNSATMSKIDSDTNTEAGRYAVGPNPSRTAVDGDANAWVGDRNQGWLTKILAITDSCQDRNGNGVIDTSSGTNVLPLGQDECVAYHNRPGGGGNIRGLAAGPDGKMWIGYSNINGGIQSINVATFQTSAVINGDSIPRFDRNGTTGSYTVRNGNIAACGVYGMVLDSDGLLYLSNTCRERLPVYDTQNNAWIGAYYFGGTTGLYGITIDGKKRVWMGSWNNRSGVRMFDPATKRLHEFTNNRGASQGVSVEPETGDVWAVHSGGGWLTRLRVNESNLAASTWTNVYTGVGWGGVGFDNNGKAWAIGTGRSQPVKINPATFTVEATPNITPSGAQHYNYSDYTGSTSRAFTAPSGRWRHVYNVQGRQVLALKVEAYVPANTSVGVRFRALDANGNATTGWYPPEINGSAQFYPYNPGNATVTIPVPQGNDNPFVAAQLDVDVRLGTTVVGTRPFLYDVEVLYDSSLSALQNAQALVTDLSNAATVGGTCTSTDSRGCDYLRVGLSYFDETYQQVTTPGEDRNITINTSVAGTSADGLTDMALVAQKIATMPELRDPNRQNFALLVTDGKANTVATITQTISQLCSAKNRAVAPVKTYTMALGVSSDFNMNSLLAAAGGDGYCCAGNSAACAPAQRIDVCTANMTTYLNQSGSGQFTQANTQNITCSGGLTAQDTLAFKLQLINYAREASSTFVAKLPNDPQMYNNPSAPQQGFLSDPDATRVIMHHGAWGATRLPFCDPNQGMTSCGLAQTLQQEKGITAPATLNAFRDEGWYFATTPNNRSVVRLTQNLADEMAGRRVRRVTMQAACQCFKPEGDPCIVAGFEDQPRSRCAAGVYSCNAQAFDICTPLFRPMPEICNGLDDSCDGKVDNLRESRGPWAEQGGLAGEYRSATCGYRDICVCSSGLKRHVGQGATPEEELASYLKDSFAGDDLCVCGEGITPEDLEVWDSGASSEGGYDAIPDAQQVGGCSSSAGGSSSAALLFLGLGLVGARRKRSRRVA